MDAEEWIEKLEGYKKYLWRFEKKLLRTLGSLATGIISYLIALWIYLWIYDVYGWERTLIAIGVGFIVFTMKERVRNA